MKIAQSLGRTLLVLLLLGSFGSLSWGQVLQKNPIPGPPKNPVSPVLPQPVAPQPPALLPCLIVEGLQFQPANPKPGDLATLSFYIKNIGNGPADPVQVEIWGMPKPFVIASQQKQTHLLAPGQSQAFSFSQKLNEESSGFYRISIDLNLYGPKIEMTPDCVIPPRKRSLEVSITPDKAFKPDLIFSSVRINPATPTRNGMAVVSIQVKNVGPKTSTAADLTACLNGLSNYDTAKVFNTMEGDQGKVPPLKKDQVHTVEFKRINQGLLLEPGNRYFYLAVLSQSDESNTSNNYTKFSFQVANVVEVATVQEKVSGGAAPKPGTPPANPGVGIPAPTRPAPTKPPTGR